jgi:FkbM family methyltransferase
MTRVSSSRLRLVRHLAAALEGYRFRGKGRLLNGLCPASGIGQRELFGRRVSLDLTDHIQRWIFLGIYEEEPTALVRAYLRPGMVVADVGANVGYYSLLALSLVGPSGRVLAFEPAARPRERLRATLEGVCNVEVLACALGSERGVSNLYVDRDADNDTPTMVASEGGVPVSVTVDTLDAFLAARGIQRLDLLKLDVEGWEPHVLDGARQVLGSGGVGAILCELNDYWLSRVGCGAEILRERLRGHGFRDVSPHLPSRSFETRLFIHESTAGPLRC